MQNRETPVTALIAVTKNLTAILNDEIDCLNNKRPAELSHYQKEKKVLMASYNKELNDIKLNGGLAAAGNADIIRQLKRESREFQKTLEKHHRIIKARKTLSERMIQDISEEIIRQKGSANKYGNDAKIAQKSLMSDTASMAINETI